MRVGQEIKGRGRRGRRAKGVEREGEQREGTRGGEARRKGYKHAPDGHNHFDHEFGTNNFGKVIIR